MKLITDSGQRPKIPYTLSYYSHWLFMMKLITDPGQRPQDSLLSVLLFSLVIHDNDGDNDDDDDDATMMMMMIMVIMMMMMILSIFAGDKNFITEWETGCN